MRTRVIGHGPVYFSWCSLVPYPSRPRVLSASRTSTRSPTFAVTPVDERFMVALTPSRAAVHMAYLCSRTLRTSKRFCFLCSTKLSRLVVCAAPSSSTAPWPREWSASPKSSLAFSQWQRDFGIFDRNSPPPSLRKFVRILATSLVPLEGKGNANGNLEARSTSNSICLLPVREAVPMERISTSRVTHGSTARPGIVAIFWLRDRFRRLHAQDAT